MKKHFWVMGLVLLLACIGGFARLAIAQEPKKDEEPPKALEQYFKLPQHPTSLDWIRRAIFIENSNSDEAFRKWLGTKARPEMSLLTAAPDKKSAYFSWLATRIAGLKLKTIKLDFKYDFSGKNGDTFSFGPGISFEKTKIFRYIVLSLDFNSVFKRDTKITSLELTGGVKLETPEEDNKFTFYTKLALGHKAPGGGDPKSFIVCLGPGIGFRPGKNERVKLEVGLLYYWASKAIYNNYDLKRQHDFVVSFSTTFSFLLKSVVISQD